MLVGNNASTDVPVEVAQLRAVASSWIRGSERTVFALKSQSRSQLAGSFSESGP